MGMLNENGEASPHVFDVTTDGFAEQVIEKSKTVPVIVDFWAAWCGPCRQLGPLLERAVASRDGKVVLAKVDTDAEQALAQRYRISSIPAVKAFYKGRVVNEFVGARDPRFIGNFLDALTPSPAAEAMEHATGLLSERDFDGAVALLKPLVADDSTLEADKRDPLRLLLAEVYMGMGPQHYAEVPPLLLAIDTRSQEAERAEILQKVLEFFAIAGKAHGDESDRLQKDEKDAEARYTLAAQKAMVGDYGAAFEHLLWLVANNRKFGEDAGRKAMLALFQYLGSDHQDVHEYRRRLQVIL